MRSYERQSSMASLCILFEPTYIGIWSAAGTFGTTAEGKEIAGGSCIIFAGPHAIYDEDSGFEEFYDEGILGTEWLNEGALGDSAISLAVFF